MRYIHTGLRFSCYIPGFFVRVTDLMRISVIFGDDIKVNRQAGVSGVVQQVSET